MWNDDDQRWPEARVVFTDVERSNWTWDDTRQQYYWHRFFSHQPDLNYDNPEVGDTMLDLVRFWLDLGFDGFRLDAVPYLYQRDGTAGEHLPETHGYIRRIRKQLEADYPGRILLAEANGWPADVADYFGDGDECHLCFHFPLMPRLFMAVRREQRYPITEILAQTPDIPEGCQWAIFLRNHDELTLEQVSEEERDYLIAEYAKDPRMKRHMGIGRRLAPLLDGDRRLAELLYALILSLPGSPVIYYGDELLMGDNIYLGDRDSVRTPMQWSPDRNGGFSKADFAQLYLPPLMDPVYGSDAVNVEAQLRNPGSFLHWLRGMLVERRAMPVMGVGEMEVLRLPQPLGAGLRALGRGGRRAGADRPRRGPTPAVGRAGDGRGPAALEVARWTDRSRRWPPATRSPTRRCRGPRRCCACTTCAVRPAGRAGAGPWAGCTPVEVLGPGALPDHQRGALHGDPRPLRLLVVRPRRPRSARRGPAVSETMLELTADRQRALGELVAAWVARHSGLDPEAGAHDVLQAEVLLAGRPGLIDVIARVGGRTAHAVVGLRSPGEEAHTLRAGDDPVLGLLEDDLGLAVGPTRCRDADLAPLMLAAVTGTQERPGPVSAAPEDPEACVLTFGDRCSLTVFPWLLRGPNPRWHCWLPSTRRASTTWRRRSPCGVGPDVTWGSSRSRWPAAPAASPWPRSPCATCSPPAARPRRPGATSPPRPVRWAP